MQFRDEGRYGQRDGEERVLFEDGTLYQKAGPTNREAVARDNEIE